MRKLALQAIVVLLLGLPLFASQADVYIASATAGADNGTSCANAHSATWFNNAADWGAGATQIGPGSTAHLCGTFTGSLGGNILTAQASGTAGNTITIKWEPGALLTSPGCSFNGNACLSVSGLSYIVVDGNGTTPSITNTAEGTVLSNHTDSWGIYANNCSNCEFKNLSITNLYVRTSTTDKLCTAILANGCGTAIQISGGTAWSIHNNTFSDMFVGAFGAFTGGTSGQQFYGNTCQHYNWCQFFGASSGTITGILLHDNHCQDSSNWDDTTGSNSYHHDCMFVSNSGTGVTNGVYVYNNLCDGDFGTFMTACLFFNQGMNNLYEFNNVIINTAARNGPWMMEGGFTGDTNYFIFNNYIDCNGGGSAGGGGGGLNFSNVSGFTFENNAMSGCGGNAYLFMTGISSPTWNHNTYAGASSGSTFYWNGSGAQTFSTYKGSSGNDAGSTTPASLGANMSTGQPLAGSAMIHDGSTNFLDLTATCSTVAALCTDKAGTARPAGTLDWDAGAYQLASSLSYSFSPSISDSSSFSMTNFIQAQQSIITFQYHGSRQ